MNTPVVITSFAHDFASPNKWRPFYLDGTDQDLTGYIDNKQKSF